MRWRTRPHAASPAACSWDAHGSKRAHREIRPWLEERGVSVGASLEISPLQNPVRRVDVRNHRKVAVIDGIVGYTGSMNIHDNDFDLDAGTWSQITARITGPATARLQHVFADDWRLSKEEPLRDERYYPADASADGTAARRNVAVQVLEDGPSYDRDSIQPMLVELAHAARSRLAITTPYFVPDEPVLLALRLAALRGVAVDLFVPYRSDRRLADAAGRALFDGLLSAGVHVHRHRRGVLHAKTVTVDDAVAVIGTANLDYRSFFLNYELVLVVHDATVAAALRSLQQAYAADAERVDLEAWRTRPTSHRVRDDVAKLFSPLL
jgi:cardiolipin synthase A/B